MTIEVVSIGSLAIGDATTAVTVPLPTTYYKDDLLVCFSWARATAGSLSSTYTHNNHSTSGGFRVLTSYRVANGIDDGSPVVTPSGMSGLQKTMHRVIAFRYVNNSTPFGTNGTFSQNSAAEDIGPLTAPSASAAIGAVLVMGCRLDSSWTGVATLSGDSLTWSELIEDKDNTVGNPLSIVLDFAPWTGGAPTLTNKTFDVTSGSALGAGMFILMNGADTKAIPLATQTQTRLAPTVTYLSSIPTKALTQTSLNPALTKKSNIPLASLAQTGITPSLSRRYPIPVKALTETNQSPTVNIRITAPIKALLQNTNTPKLTSQHNIPKQTVVQASLTATLHFALSIPKVSTVQNILNPTVTKLAHVPSLSTTQVQVAPKLSKLAHIPNLHETQAVLAPSNSGEIVPTLTFYQSSQTPHLSFDYKLPTLTQSETQQNPKVSKKYNVSLLQQSQSATAPSISRKYAIPLHAFTSSNIAPKIRRDVRVSILAQLQQYIEPRLGGGVIIEYTSTYHNPTIVYGGIQIDVLKIQQEYPEPRFAHDPYVIPNVIHYQQVGLNPQTRNTNPKLSNSYRRKMLRRARRRRHYDMTPYLLLQLKQGLLTPKALQKVQLPKLQQSVNTLPPQLHIPDSNVHLAFVQSNLSPKASLNAHIDLIAQTQNNLPPYVAALAPNVSLLAFAQIEHAPSVGINNKGIPSLQYTQHTLYPSVAASKVVSVQTTFAPSITAVTHTPVLAQVETLLAPTITAKTPLPLHQSIETTLSPKLQLRYTAEYRTIVQGLNSPEVILRLMQRAPALVTIQNNQIPTVQLLHNVSYVNIQQVNLSPRLVRRYNAPKLSVIQSILLPQIQSIPPDYIVSTVSEFRTVASIAENRILLYPVTERIVTAPAELRKGS